MPRGLCSGSCRRLIRNRVGTTTPQRTSWSVWSTSTLFASATAPTEIELAIWFHDAVYDPKAGDNEERSADWAFRAMQDARCPADAIEAVRSMVLATKTHIAATEDEALLLDIDLGITAPFERFQRYDSQIRLEYEWVPLEQYRAARKDVLQGFLGP